MATVKLYCVARRCGLCRFRFLKGETIIAVKPSGELSEAFDCEVPVDFRGNTFYIICHSASVRECYHENRAVGCHLDCLKLMPAKSPWEFMNAMSYSFEPPKATEQSRRTMLQYRLAENLNTPVYLPPELRFNMAKHLLHQYAAGLATALPFCSNAPSFSVEFSKHVWSSNIEFEGVEYLASLTNNYDSDENKATSDRSIVLHANREATALYICEDQWGVRKVVFGSAREPPFADALPGVWWKTLSISDSQSLLDVQTDASPASGGIKVKSISSVNGNERISSSDLVSWAIPQPLLVKLRVYKFYQDFRAHMPLARMALLPYNEAKTTGYSVCCNPGPITIHAHVAGEADPSLYEQSSESLVWIHVPLNASEFVTEFWMRTLGTSHAALALLFKTNQDRTFLMGTRLPPVASHAMWTLLDKSDGVPGRFFIDRCSPGIRTLAFENLAKPESSESEPLLPRSISAFPQQRRRDGPFYSSASLESVKSVTTCRRKVQSKFSIIGLLLHYWDGHSETLGQIRFDCLDQPTLINDSERFSLGFALTDSGHYYAKEISFGTPTEKAECEWFEMTWDGTLEWWFSSYDCQVCYKGRTSPA